MTIKSKSRPLKQVEIKLLVGWMHQRGDAKFLLQIRDELLARNTLQSRALAMELSEKIVRIQDAFLREFVAEGQREREATSRLHLVKAPSLDSDHGRASG
jgi:hypothetical protein